MWYSPVAPSIPWPKPEVKVRIIERDGRRFTIRESGAGEGILVSMDSPDPTDYLNPKWQPGSVFEIEGED